MNGMIGKVTRAWMALTLMAAALRPERRASGVVEELAWRFRSEAFAEDLQ
jgi:hypothetical protein